MINKKWFTLILAISLLAFNTETKAQENDKDKKEFKEKKEHKEKKEKKQKKEKKEKFKEEKYKVKTENKDKDEKWDKEDKVDKKDKDDRENNNRGILGRVILPRNGTIGPRQLAGVPKGHYPPPGSCRIWYPNRPPGHQPPPTSCNSLVGARLEPGAFILHGDKAYDSEYDWKQEENRRPGSVKRDVLDILFPPKQ